MHLLRFALVRVGRGWFKRDAHESAAFASSGMRTIKTLSDLSSDWLLRKWSVLIGREQVSRD